MTAPNKDTEQDKKIDELKERIKELKADLKESKSKDIPSEKMSLGYLLSHVKLTQLWGVVVIIFGLISGAATMTYRFANKKSDAQLLTENAKYELEVSKMQMQITGLNSEVDEYKKKDKFFADLEIKEKFLASYLNYVLAGEKCERVEFNKNKKVCKVFAGNRKIFANTISILWKKRHTSADQSHEGVIIGLNGGLEGATIKFLYDGTTWPIPIEFTDLLVDE